MNPYLSDTIVFLLGLAIGFGLKPFLRWAVAERARTRRPLARWQNTMLIVALAWLGTAALFGVVVGLDHPVRWPDRQTETISDVLTFSAMTYAVAALIVLWRTDPGPRPDDPDLFV